MGANLATATRALLDAYLPRMQANSGLQLGMSDLLGQSALSACNWVMAGPDIDCGNALPRIASDPQALPFCADAFDLVLLPFVLELCDDPAQVFNECYRVLRPEGYLLILAFNPRSLFGLLRRWRLWRQDSAWPWKTPFTSVGDLKKSLIAGDFECKQGRFFQYRLWLRPVRTRPRYRWIELAGDRWWPTWGNAYLLLAQRREPGWIGPERIPQRLIHSIPQAGVWHSQEKP